MRNARRTQRSARKDAKKVCRRLACDPYHDPVTGKRISSRQRKRLQRECNKTCKKSEGDQTAGCADFGDLDLNSDSDDDCDLICGFSSKRDACDDDSDSCDDLSDSCSSDSSSCTSSDDDDCDFSKMDASHGSDIDFSGADSSHLLRGAVSDGHVLSKQRSRNGRLEMPKEVSRRTMRRQKREIARVYQHGEEKTAEESKSKFDDALKKLRLNDNRLNDSELNALEALNYLTGTAESTTAEEIFKKTFKRAQRDVKKCGASQERLQCYYDSKMKSMSRRNLWRVLEGVSHGKRTRICPVTGKAAVQGQALWRVIESAIARVGRSRSHKDAVDGRRGGEEQHIRRRPLGPQDRSGMDRSGFTFL